MAMTKAEWASVHNDLNESYRELAIAESDYKNGRNQKIKKDGQRKMELAIFSVKATFRNFPEVHIMAAGGEEVAKMGMGLGMDEFFNLRYIVSDLGGLLLKIKEKIKSFDT